VQHCFQCGASAEAQGVDGILKGYRDTFASGLIMSGPTDITQVIQAAGARAINTAEEKQAYTILVILTDGSVSDVEATANGLNQIQQAPLSIVIVGIGDGDFSDMSFLDEKGDGQRDIAQFVPFGEYADNMDSLTEATLNEIPGQLVDYFVSKDIQPNPPIALEAEEIPVEPFNEEDESDLTLTFGDDDEINFEGDPPAPIEVKPTPSAGQLGEGATFLKHSKNQMGRIDNRGSTRHRGAGN
jgi:hypothetical protein